MSKLSSKEVKNVEGHRVGKWRGRDLNWHSDSKTHILDYNTTCVPISLGSSIWMISCKTSPILENRQPIQMPLMTSISQFPCQGDSGNVDRRAWFLHVHQSGLSIYLPTRKSGFLWRWEAPNLSMSSLNLSRWLGTLAFYGTKQCNNTNNNNSYST